MKASEVMAILARYHGFRDCQLTRLETAHFGMALRLHVAYMWDDIADGPPRLRSMPRPVIIDLMPVWEVRIRNEFSEGVIEDPGSVNWGLTEFAEIALERTAVMTGPYRHRPGRKKHHLGVIWQNGTRVDVVFESLTVTDIA
jgi:hypothetical protein